MSVTGVTPETLALSFEESRFVIDCNLQVFVDNIGFAINGLNLITLYIAFPCGPLVRLKQGKIDILVMCQSIELVNRCTWGHKAGVD